MISPLPRKDPELMKSWIASANTPDSHFPIQNLPYGVFARRAEMPRCGVAIGASVLDLAALEDAGVLDTRVFREPQLNAFMTLGPRVWDETRARLTELLREGGDPSLSGDSGLRTHALISSTNVTMHLPFKVSGYTDFYAGKHHASNVGTMFRGAENALPPNWLSIPIGYNGRASTVIVTGTPFRRPLGQTKPPGTELPLFGPCKRLDIELEMGVVVGQPSEFGEPLTVSQADDLIFGYVLLNDWSARDIQTWEYQPLGPFQAKAFATTIGAWVVPKAALEPFRVSTPPRERPLLPYLQEPRSLLYDISLEAKLQPKGAATATTITRTNYREVYYSAAQQLAHHAVCGCKIEVGDLLGSGTISGTTKESRGSLLELSWGGAEPVELETGETRTFLEDGDVVTLTGYAQAEGYRIGFGECAGEVLPAPAEPKWS
jgi:fumarylacetoacetase